MTARMLEQTNATPLVADIQTDLHQLPCYATAYLETRHRTTITLTGDDCHVDFQTVQGGAVRTRLNQVWQSHVFSSWQALRSQLPGMARHARGSTTAALPNPEPVVYQQPAPPEPFQLASLLAQLQIYADLVRRPGHIDDVQIRFCYEMLETHFMNSVGTHIIQHQPCYWGVITGVTRQQRQTQLIHISGVDEANFAARDAYIRQRIAHWHKPDAPVVRRGQYPVVMDPAMTGLFIHEGFGHLREADNLSASLGSHGDDYRVSIDALSIIDDATHPGLAGSYAYDHEGTPARKTTLVASGRLTGRLHSRDTAHYWQETPTGHARTASYRDAPLPRMACTYLAPGKTDVAHLLDGIQTGVYAAGSRGGTTNGQVFVFAPAEARMIRNGELAERVSDVVLTGEIFKTLRSIEAIGNDFEWSPGASCTKAHQFLPRISWGGPHLRVHNITIGGA